MSEHAVSYCFKKYVEKSWKGKKLGNAEYKLFEHFFVTGYLTAVLAIEELHSEIPLEILLKTLSKDATSLLAQRKAELYKAN